MPYGFLTRLICSPQPDGVNWLVTYHLIFQPRRQPPVTVPAGFTTDFASIPPLATIFGVLLAASLPATLELAWYHLTLAGVILDLWCGFCLFVVIVSDSLNCDDRLDAGATVHDFIYRTRERSRWQADAILREAIWTNLYTVPKGNLWQRGKIWITNDLAWVKCLTIWFNVRVFGWLAWRADRKFCADKLKSYPDID